VTEAGRSRNILGVSGKISVTSSPVLLLMFYVYFNSLSTDTPMSQLNKSSLTLDRQTVLPQQPLKALSTTHVLSLIAVKELNVNSKV